MITSLFASILALIYFKISIDTVRARKKNQISLGNGDNNEILKYVSAHSNFSSYVPILLILTFLLESSNQFSDIIIVIMGTAFTLGRIFHYIAFSSEKMNFKLRTAGMLLTLFPMNILAVLNVIAFFSEMNG